ncbi:MULTISPECIES: hypothetical protein [unclassified Streptomyces]|uniref:hypothetical protein n=1 Tax=unclassified Streptomyces TaxID=2593676 RepID=UPI0035DB0674
MRKPDDFRPHTIAGCSDKLHLPLLRLMITLSALPLPFGLLCDSFDLRPAPVDVNSACADVRRLEEEEHVGAPDVRPGAFLRRTVDRSESTHAQRYPSPPSARCARHYGHVGPVRNTEREKHFLAKGALGK